MALTEIESQWERSRRSEAVGDFIDAIKLLRCAQGEAIEHGRGPFRFNAVDAAIGPHRFQRNGHSCRKTSSSNRNHDGVKWLALRA